MRFHVVSLPHTQTTDAYSACAFTEKVRKFCIMMKNRGHTVFLYAGEQNDAPCDEHIVCISEADRAAHVGDKHYIFASFDYSLPVWKAFNSKAAAAIRERAEPTDFICVIGGLAHKQIADELPHLTTVEFGIGYGGTFATFRVWESMAWMHCCYGAASHGNPNAADGQWFDAVIPGYFEVERFPFSAEKDDYYFFIGRLTARKGFQIAIDVCKDLGKKLIVAGQCDPGMAPPKDCEYVGVIGPEERGRLMSRAKAVFVPTIYIEPFGNVAVEAMGCGTPVLSTDWGAMTETVIHGVTGFRCRTFGEFRRAAENVHTLNPHQIRRHAVQNYSLETIGLKYEQYFERLSHLWSDGWYEGRQSGRSTI
jgi:glycosyltransferase involved in cell wall biosynthesis